MNSEATDKLLKVIEADLATNPDVTVESEVKADWKEELTQYEERRKRRISALEERRKRYEEYINRSEAYMNSKERLKRYEEYKNR